MKRRVRSDNHSGHGLPIGAEVEMLEETPEWAKGEFPLDWYTQGGDGDEVAIDERDLEPITWWHCYGGVATEGDMDGLWMQVMAGPTKEPPGGVNGKGVPLKEMFRESNPYLKYLGSFDHEPSEP